MMELRAHDEGRAVVITLSGMIRDDADMKELAGYLERHGTRALILDLTLLKYINSQGISILLMAWRRARREGGQFFLASTRGEVRRVFEMTHLSSILPTKETVAEALREIDREHKDTGEGI